MPELLLPLHSSTSFLCPTALGHGLGRQRGSPTAQGHGQGQDTYCHSGRPLPQIQSGQSVAVPHLAAKFTMRPQWQCSSHHGIVPSRDQKTCCLRTPLAVLEPPVQTEALHVTVPIFETDAEMQAKVLS